MGWTGVDAVGHADEPTPSSVPSVRGTLTDGFEANDGQLPSDVLFSTKVKEGFVHLRQTQLDFYLIVDARPLELPVGYQICEVQQPVLRRTTVRFEGANSSAILEPQQPARRTPSTCVLLRNKAAASIPLRHFGEVLYQEVWPGVDVRCKAAAHGFEWDFNLDEGAALESVQMKLVGGGLTSRRDDRTIAIEFPEGVTYLFRFPQSFITSEYGVQDARSVVPLIDSQGVIRFQLADNPREYAGILTIDPQIVPENPIFSYMGGDEADLCFDSARTASGGTILVGCTLSSNFPTEPAQAYQSAFFGGFDGFVAAFDAGLDLVWSTYLNGEPSADPLGVSVDIIRTVDVDPLGNAYVGVLTYSMLFPDPPVSGPLPAQTFFGGAYGDAVVAKLENAGTSVGYCAYFSGSRGDVPMDIKIDPAGNAYICGHTTSTTVVASPFEFPTTSGCVEPVSNANAVVGFVSKLNPSGTAFIFSTFVGVGNQALSGTFYPPDGVVPYSLALDFAGIDATRPSIVVAGSTITDTMLLVSAHQTTHGGGVTDAFVMRLDPDGSAYTFGTLFGGSGNDVARDVGVFPNRQIVVAGTTTSPNLLMINAFQSQIGGFADAFVARFDPSGVTPSARLTFSSYYGGGGAEDVWGLANDTSRSFYVVGSTTGSSALPMVAAVQGLPNPDGGSDGFVFKVMGQALQMSSVIGGNGLDVVTDVGIDTSGYCLVGNTKSSNFSTYYLDSGFSNSIATGGLGLTSPFGTPGSSNPTLPDWDVDGTSLEVVNPGTDAFIVKGAHP